MSAAAEMSATWYELSAPSSTLVVETAAAIPVERLTQSAEWALGAKGEQGLARLEGTVQRAVFDGARETTLINVAREPGSRWVRHARPEACAFCRMMATRYENPRMWYRSEESALNVVGRGRAGRARGKRKVGSKGYHDDCRCIAVEVRPGQDYEPPEYVQAWNEELAKAQANAGKNDARSILAAWRDQGAR
ncbi:capsid maturation protease [Mycobacterium phage Renaud18]|uniref:Capsid maturation protease n=1 Tax=Mycobacterium phage Renaud18 TaxID=2301701 RepID=A0A385E242_9CAUD|nr:head maturation protease [Mycobacterium phage Renaud18]AXQ64915.1 capsid maturation protease [Mycobacterium phage Renaud18]UCR74380.1 capsid maturation protease [Mycobacterium phage Saroj]UZV39530.1 capsid maturation protease [Mycobacterium phage Ritam007]